MKIAMLVPIVESIPPEKYGGTERVVYHLTEELVKMGHDVTLFASGDSKTSANLLSVYPKSLRQPGSLAEEIYGPNGYTMLNIGLCYYMQDQFDVIHDHHNIISNPTANLSQTPVVMTIHGALDVDPAHVSLYEATDNINYVSISKSQQEPAPNLNWIGNVYNGTISDKMPFSSTSDDYLLFVGRMSPQKGLHHAIEVAKRLDLPLIIAAKLENSREHQIYYKEKIEPELNDKIRWVGEVDETERNKLMTKALAFLHPVTWREPFGLTLAEAMCCGAPVVAFGLGSIPEIIDHKKTGYVIAPGDVDGMVEAVRNIKKISRARCRQHTLANFSTRKMAENYVAVYQKAILKKKMLTVPSAFYPLPSILDPLTQPVNSFAHEIPRPKKLLKKD
jgi:glycosyltransferase involved in cell wall biosynthesis